MTALLKNAFNISHNTLLFQSSKLTLSCTRAVFSTTPRTLFHTSNSNKEARNNIEQDIPVQPHFSPIELLREKAYKVEQQASLRSRCNWTKEENEKLLDLINTYGKRWTFISRQFVDRSPSNVMNRYQLINDANSRGPWSKEELKALADIGEGKAFHEIQDWKSIQEKLPRKRPLFMVKQTYKHTIDPHIKHGRWTSDEVDKLRGLIQKYGENNMEQVALLMGSRTQRQCLERWRWQMTNEKKGRFSKDEGDRILDAVEKYGENFAVVAKVAGIARTPRHISQHYHNVLAPDIDRSEWTQEEEEKVYTSCMKHGRDMIKAKEELGSKRSKRDMWNHFNRYEKYFVKNKSSVEE